jgi:hypothetical protein
MPLLEHIREDQANIILALSGIMVERGISHKNRIQQGCHIWFFPP